FARLFAGAAPAARPFPLAVKAERTSDTQKHRRLDILMTTATHSHDEPAHHLKLEYQPGLPIPLGKTIVWLFLSTEIMFFAGLIGTYVVLRFGAPTWPQTHEVHLSEPIGAFNTFVLICSSVTVVLALEAAKAHKAGVAKMFTFVTLVLGSV